MCVIIVYVVVIIMRCIGKLTDEDFNLESVPLNNPRIRYAARGIIFNEDGKVAILYKQNKNEFKLIGGGIEEDEDPKEAFKRETLEETGYKIEIYECLGTFDEIKTHDNFKQTSYVYVAKALKKVNNPQYTEKELKENSKFLWLDLENALKIIKASQKNILPSKFESRLSLYHTRFVVRRDYLILKYYKQNYY